MDSREIYNDPIISRKRLGTDKSPFREITESVLVERNHALLTEIPNRLEKVIVAGTEGKYYETRDEKLSDNTFRVDYTNGVVFFDSSSNGKTLTFKYLGEGAYYFPDSRIYLTDKMQEGTARDKFKDLDRGILEQKSRVDEQLRSVPQPSELVDVRVDHNGKIFPVAKDRIDAEQIKIEEAYTDVHGVEFGSLKERIDSLQIKIGNDIDDVTGELTDTNASITLLSNQIELQVSEIRTDVEGELESFRSTINLFSDEIDLKVDANGVISSLNLSEEGVRISGDKVWIDGETRIDNGVIKSAHIEDLNADKIKAGTIDSGLVTVRNNNDPNKYAEMNSTGLLIKGGAISIERPDGFTLINNGQLNAEFAVQGANPPFRDISGVTQRGQWLDVDSSQRRRIDRYTFLHAGRYLIIDMARYVQSGGEGVVYVENNNNGELLWSMAFDNNDLHNAANYLQSHTIDLGVPTGGKMSVIIRARTTVSGVPMSMHIGRVSISG